MDFIQTLIGLPETSHLIGCCHLNNTKDLKDHGGNVFNATKYFIQQHFAVAKIVIRSLVIVGVVIQNDADLQVSRLSARDSKIEVSMLDAIEKKPLEWNVHQMLLPQFHTKSSMRRSDRSRIHQRDTQVIKPRAKPSKHSLPQSLQQPRPM